MAYQPGVPTGSVPLNQDYKNLQDNFTSLDTQWVKDHVALTTASGPSIGYHKFVHLVPFSTTVSDPPNNQPVVAAPTTAGFGQLFGAEINDGLNTDQALYYLTGGNRLTQLTRNFQPSPTAIGWTFLPGGLIMQWGSGSSGVPITFNVAAKFNTVFSIQVTPTSLSVSPAPGVAFNNLIFTADNVPHQNFGFLWMAIGI